MLVIVDRQQQIAVLCAEQIGGDLAADRLVAELLLVMPRDGEIGDLGGQERQARLQHRNVYELAVPVCVRWNKAEDTANAAVDPDSTSHTANPARVGPISGWPVIAMMPDIAWILPS